MLKKICAYPGCTEIVDIGQRYCTKHQKIYEEKRKQDRKERDKEYKKNRQDIEEQKFYKSREWELVRDAAIVRDKALCRLCLHEGKIAFAEVVHHIVPIKERWDLRYDLSNLVCLCDACHNRVHKLYKQDKEKYFQLMEEIKKE
ncbi:HNH endonuclease [Caldanaerobacter subterraneus]|uniref:Putative HNH nuclease YajD n=1 Tax=Caldanaerobacter subterraneus TaxID=911092 RepID=A0A7Y2PM05_9THEO|nr:HNH endonuclease [Caldanaerobacter subterraneus]NNG66146.1 HNH endonuclease [Caldanaerobacter subterraneus]